MTLSSGPDAPRKASPSDSIFQPGAIEEERLAALRRYDILDTEREKAFDRLTILAADLFDVEVAFVAFLDTDRQWLRSKVGLNEKEAGFAGTFCTRTIQKESLLDVEDAAGEEQAEQSRDAGGPGLRFYAGVPILSPGGHPIGTFSLMDPKPKVLSEEERGRLRDLAEMAMEELERRREARKSKRKAHRYEQVARRFDAVLEDPNILAGVLAPGGRLLEANETALGYIEESEEEVTGELFWETPWWPEEVSSQIKENVEQAAEGEYVEYEADLTDAEERPYSVVGTIRPVRGEGQETEALVVSARDVTERKRREEDLRRARRQYRAVFEDPGMLVGLLGPDGTVLDINQTALTHVERPLEEIEGERFWETPWFEGDEALQEEVRGWIRAATAGEYVEFEADLTEAVGKPLVVEGAVRPVTDQEGTVTSLLISARDVTERKLQERELRVFEEVFNQANDGIVVTEAEPLEEPGPRIEHVNEAFEEMTGWAEEEILGKTPRVFQGPDTDRETLESLRAALEAGEAWEGETINYRKDGTPYRVRWSIAPVRGQDGEIEHWSSVHQDVTETRAREEKLRRQKALLEQTQRLAGAWEIDLKAEELSWSEKVYEIHEVEPGTDIEIEEGIEFYAPEARPAIRTAFEKCAKEGEPYDLELPIITAEGNRRWVRTVGAPVEKRTGEATKVAGAVQDITDRKEEERRRKQVIRRVTDAIVEVDSGWRFTLVNDQAEELYDMAEENLLGKEFWEVFTGAIGTRLEEEYRGVMNTREPVRLVEHYPGLDGWFDIGVYPNEDGGIAFYFEEVTEQKERQRRLDAVFNHTYQFTGLIEPDGTVIEANDTALQFGGLDEEDVLGRPLWDAFWFEGKESRQERVRTAVARAREGEFVRYEVEVRGAEEDRIIDFSLRPITDESGNVTMIVPEGRDITERKRRERRLRVTSQRLEAILEHTTRPMFVKDRNGEYLLTNRRFRELFGLEEGEALGRTDEDLFPPEMAQTIQENDQTVLREGTSVEKEERIHADGEWRTYLSAKSPLYDVGTERDRDAPVALFGTAADITERKWRERTLRQRRQVAESLYDATGRLLRTESKGDISDRIFEVLEDVFDYPFVHVGLANEGVIVPQKTAAEGLSRKPTTEPQPVSEDLVVTRALRAGETVVIEEIGTLDNDLDYGSLSSLAGIPIGKRGAVVVGTEQAEKFDRFDLHLMEVMARYAALVLERLDREEKLVEAKEEAERMNRLKSAFLANMSHEIRTPLTSVLGFSEMIGEEVGQAEEASEVDLSAVAEFSSLIERSGQRLMNTLTGVLNLSKLQAGEMDIDPGPVDLAPETREVAQELRLQAMEAGVEMSVEGGRARAWADEGGVRIALRNLLSNAIKYTEEGGKVWVRVRQGEDMAVVEVEDTGIGMDPKETQGLFEAFKQASEGIGREYEGSGLGLTVTKEVVEQMGGSVEVETEKGEGSRFTVRLPRSEHSGEA